MRHIPIVFLLALLSAWPVHADEARQNREKEALRRSQQQLQQAARERASLQEKLGKSDQELESLKGEIGQAQAQARSEGQRNRALQAALDAAQAQTRTLQSRVAEQEQQLAVAAQRTSQLESELKLSQAQRKKLEGTLQARNQQISACDGKNRELYAVGRQLIETCDRKGALDTALRLEPFAGLGRVQQENALERARDQLEEHRLRPQESGP